MAFRSSSPACAIIRAKAPHLTKPRRGRLLTSAAQPLIWHLLWLINAIHLVTKGAFFYIKVSGVKWYPEGQESSATVMVSIFRMSGQEKWVITAISSVHTWARERFLSSQPPPEERSFSTYGQEISRKVCWVTSLIKWHQHTHHRIWSLLFALHLLTATAVTVRRGRNISQQQTVYYCPINGCNERRNGMSMTMSLGWGCFCALQRH